MILGAACRRLSRLVLPLPERLKGGAALNAEMELQTARDTTTGPPRPIGERGAYSAWPITLPEPEAGGFTRPHHPANRR